MEIENIIPNALVLAKLYLIKVHLDLLVNRFKTGGFQLKDNRITDLIDTATPFTIHYFACMFSYASDTKPEDIPW